MKKMFRNKINEQEILKRPKIKIETEKLKKADKIGGHKIRIESIRDKIKRERENLKIERINKLNRIGKVKVVLKGLRIEIKINELANNLDIRLLKRTKTSSLNIAEQITNEKDLKVKPIDSSFKNKRVAYCFELPFGIISSSSYVNTETMNIISSDVGMNKVLINNPSNLIYCLLLLKQLSQKIC